MSPHRWITPYHSTTELLNHPSQFLESSLFQILQLSTSSFPNMPCYHITSGRTTLQEDGTGESDRSSVLKIALGKCLLLGDRFLEALVQFHNERPEVFFLSKNYIQKKMLKKMFWRRYASKAKLSLAEVWMGDPRRGRWRSEGGSPAWLRL